MKHSRHEKAAIALGSVLLAAASAALAQDPQNATLEAPTVEVIGTTPLPGLGTPIEQFPGNVKAATAKDLERTQSINLPDFLSQSLPSVNVNEVQGNPFQPDLNYRGFTASPLLGTPQGLSVFQDGVRVNEVFGDVVNWDLIPQPAISTINLIPGSNPLFGLNTLGGALSVRTKSGFYYPNTELSAYGGSFGTWSVEAQHGGYTDTNDYYLAANIFEQDGWRDFSPTTVQQFFGKIGHESGGTDLDLSFTYANNDLTGNGVAPESMLQQRRSQVFTVPDNTMNEMYMVNLTGSHWFGNNWLAAGNVYYRRNRTPTLNGDANDDFEDGGFDGAAGGTSCPIPDPAGCNVETAVDNRTKTIQSSYGLGLQVSNIQERNRLTVGASLDNGRADFTQSSTVGIFNSDRGVIEQAPEQLEDSLFGTTRTWSLFATDNFTLTPQWFLTVSGRFNQTNVTTQDRINLTPPNLDNDFTYSKFNPAIGVNYNPTPAFNPYAGWSQGNRAPSPIELGCADPNNPCTLPNALAADPFLEQVVAQTWELGARGILSERIGWSAAVYRTTSKDDILFVSTGTSAGFFTNFGKTRRQGVELGLNGQWRYLRWGANYAFVNATFQSSACLLSENNSTRGTSSCLSDDEILVSPGDQIPGIPEHQFNLGLHVDVTPKWTIGATVTAFSSQNARGNENNQHQPGTFTDNFGNTRTFQGKGQTGGYVTANLFMSHRITPRWEVFARVNNLFDRDYSTAAILAENPFNAAGVFQTNSDNWARETFFAPGAPRAGWVGIKYVFGRSPRK